MPLRVRWGDGIRVRAGPGMERPMPGEMAFPIRLEKPIQPLRRHSRSQLRSWRRSRAARFYLSSRSKNRKKRGQTCHFPLSQEKKGNDTSGPFFCSYFGSRTRRNPALLFLKFGGIAKRLETRISMAVRSQEPPRRTLLSPLLFTGSLTAFFL